MSGHFLTYFFIERKLLLHVIHPSAHTQQSHLLPDEQHGPRPTNQHDNNESGYLGKRERLRLCEIIYEWGKNKNKKQKEIEKRSDSAQWNDLIKSNLSLKTGARLIVSKKQG